MLDYKIMTIVRSSLSTPSSGADTARCTQIAKMALSTSTESVAAGTMGDTLPREVPAESKISHSRFVLWHDRKPWNAHILHDRSSDSLLVRLHRHGQSVSP